MLNLNNISKDRLLLNLKLKLKTKFIQILKKFIEYE